MKFITNNNNTYFIDPKGRVTLENFTPNNYSSNNNIEFVELTNEDIKLQLANLKQLTLEVTDACNLSCTYCAYGEFYCDYDQRKNTNLQYEKAIKIIDFLNDYWNSELNMSNRKNVYISFYGGEPLLNIKLIRKIINYVKNIKNQSRFYTFSMTTNGMLLDKHIDYLVENDFNLLVSLDGDYNNNVYRVDKKGRSSFKKITDNIELVSQKYPVFFDTNINFNAVLHNKNSVAEIYSFFKDKYNKIPSISELNDMGIRPDKKKQFLDTHKNYYESLSQTNNPLEIEKEMFIKSNTYQTLSTYIHRYSGFVFDDYNDLIFGKSDKLIPTGTCIPFSKRMYITVNGKILPCERIGQQFALGTITNDKIELDIPMIVAKYNNYLNKIKTQCTQCYVARACTMCIFNIDSIENKCSCNNFTNSKNFVMDIASQVEFLEHNPLDYAKIMNEIIID